MTAKDALNAIRFEDAAIQRIIERGERYTDMATRATSSTEAERVSGTGCRSKVEDCVCRKVDYEAKHHVNERIDRLADMRHDAGETIKRIEQPRFQQVLTLRYLMHNSWLWTWERIAREMGISVMHTHRIHGFALLAFARLPRNDP